MADEERHIVEFDSEKCELPMNRFKADEVWFTSKDNRLEDIGNEEWGINTIYAKKEDNRYIYAVVSWTYGSALLWYVLDDGKFMWGDEYLEMAKELADD